MRRFEIDFLSRCICVVAVAVSVIGCSLPGTPGSSPTLPPASSTPPLPTETLRPSLPPVPTPDPRDELRQLPPSSLVRVEILQEPHYPLSVLKVLHYSHNACTDRGEHRVEWRPGQIRVHVQQLVRIPPGGCPRGSLNVIQHTIPLDQLTNGDQILVNGLFWFHATNQFCRDFGFTRCPVGCIPTCVSPGIVTACDPVPKQCPPPDRKYTPTEGQLMLRDER